MQNRWDEKAAALREANAANGKILHHHPDRMQLLARQVTQAWDRLEGLLRTRNLTLGEALLKVPGVPPGDSAAFAANLHHAVEVFREMSRSRPEPSSTVHTRRHMMRV